MHVRSYTILVAAWLICTVSPGSAQSRAASDSDLDRSIGHWVATGVSFQSGDQGHPFAVDVKRADSRLQITLPAELKLAGGSVYVLARTGNGVFRHADEAGRIVEFSLTASNRAALLITGSGGDGRVTWQLSR
jgi:hypothetical protein